MPKKTTFLTEGSASNPDGQDPGAPTTTNEAHATDQQAQIEQQAGLENRESSGVAETTESENREDEEEEEDEDEASDDDYVDYVNPFYPQYSHTQPTDSDKEKNQSSDNPDEDQSSGDVRPISAVAPKVLQQDDTQVEISSTPAFQCLEEVGSPFGVRNP